MVMLARVQGVGFEHGIVSGFYGNRWVKMVRSLIHLAELGWIIWLGALGFRIWESGAWLDGVGDVG